MKMIRAATLAALVAAVMAGGAGHHSANAQTLSSSDIEDSPLYDCMNVAFTDGNAFAFNECGTKIRVGWCGYYEDISECADGYEYTIRIPHGNFGALETEGLRINIVWGVCSDPTKPKLVTVETVAEFDGVYTCDDEYYYELVTGTSEEWNAKKEGKKKEGEEDAASISENGSSSGSTGEQIIELLKNRNPNYRDGIIEYSEHSIDEEGNFEQQVQYYNPSFQSVRWIESRGWNWGEVEITEIKWDDDNKNGNIEIYCKGEEWCEWSRNLELDDGRETGSVGRGSRLYFMDRDHEYSYEQGDEFKFTSENEFFEIAEKLQELISRY